MTVNQKPNEKIRVIGAGFAGLTCAYYLAKAGFKVEVYEKTNRVGGLLQSTKSPYGLIENAANAFMNSDRLESLANEIGVRLQPSLKASRSRYIFRKHPRRFPVNYSEIVGLIKFLFRIIFLRSSLTPNSSESIRDWGGRVLTPTLSLYTVETALQGIYAGDPKKMSASLILRNLFQKRSKQMARPGSVAPKDGMGEFVEKLHQYLKSHGVDFFCNQDLQFKEISMPTVFAVPAFEAGRLLALVDPILSEKLLKIEYVPLISAQVFLEESSESLNGFGCLFPPESKNIVLGVLFNHCIFEDRTKNAKSEKWILGGASIQDRKEFLALSDHEILSKIFEKRRQLLKGTEKWTETEMMKCVLSVQISRWSRAFPDYTTDLEFILSSLQTENKNILLHGNYLGGLGLTKILDRSARMAEQMNLSFQKEIS